MRRIFWIVFCLFSLEAPQVGAFSQSELRGFQIGSCGPGGCFQAHGAKAHTSFLTATMAASNVQIQLQLKDSSSTKFFQCSSLTFDIHRSYVACDTGMENRAGTLTWDLHFPEFHFYPSAP